MKQGVADLHEINNLKDHSITGSNSFTTSQHEIEVDNTTCVQK